MKLKASKTLLAAGSDLVWCAGFACFILTIGKGGRPNSAPEAFAESGRIMESTGKGNLCYRIFPVLEHFLRDPDPVFRQVFLGGFAAAVSENPVQVRPVNPHKLRDICHGNRIPKIIPDIRQCGSEV